MQQLEEQLGVKLFERRTRALVLTDAGDRYYRDVSKALDQLREATAAVRVQATPVVRVTTTLTFASLWLVPRLASFQKEHADISVHVVADNVVRDLERNSLDVALRYCPEEAAGPGAEKLFGEQVAPVAAPALLKGQRIRGVEDLLRLPLIELEDPNGTALWLSWKVWCEAMGVARPRTSRVLTFSHYDQVVQAVVCGTGGGARPLSAARPVPRGATARHAPERPAVRDARAPCLLARRRTGRSTASGGEDIHGLAAQAGRRATRPRLATQLLLRPTPLSRSLASAAGPAAV